MFYIRAALIFVWVAIVSVVSFFMCLLRWGHINLVSQIGRAYGRGALKIIGIQVEIFGREHLEAHQPCIYVCNHQSGFDVLSIGSFCPKDTISIGKKEIIWVPFFGIVYKASGNVMIDRKDRARAISNLGEVMKKARDKGASIIIFPEGTRNRTGEGMLPFKKGAFYMAAGAKVPIVPMICSPLSPLVSMKHRRLVPGKLQFRILPPIAPRDDVEGLLKETRDKMIEALRGLSTQPLP